jgi:PAS domain S-box-containing protein
VTDIQLHVFKSRQKRAAEAEIESFRKHLGPFVAAAETTRMPMVFTDAKASDSTIVFANKSFLALAGFAREDILGQPFSFLVAQRREPTASLAILAAFEDTADSYMDVCYRRKDGALFWADTFVGQVLDKKGETVQRFVSFHDLTKHIQEEERLRLLLDELNHRTQNTLATVQSIAVQTLRGAADDAVVEVFEGRILALSRGHSLLGRDSWETVSLRDLIGQMLQPFGLDDLRVARFSVEGEDVRLAPKAALTLAMVLHELVTNAAKFGALSNAETGKIEIAWELELSPKGRQMRLRWQENGGPPVLPNGHKGFGSRLIEGALAHELRGEVRLSFGVAGVVCQIDMPIPLELS